MRIMALLIDKPLWQFRGEKWSHLVSDESYDELHGFAKKLGIPRRAFQGDHYDIPERLRDRAIELGAEIMLKGTKVDGIYDKDPVKNKDATLYKEISYSEIIAKNLAVMDATAVVMCQENKMPLKVFNILKNGNLKNVILDDKIGTKII